LGESLPKSGAGGLFQLFSGKPCEKQKYCLSLHGQIVVRGREKNAFAAIFKLDLSDPHTRTWPQGYVLSFSSNSSIKCLMISFSELAKTSCFTTTALPL
jgi:hypothetical protein